MANKAWPQREIKIGDGYDWTIHLFDPTLIELEALQEAYKKAEWPEIKRLSAGLFIDWDAIDKTGKPLPVPTMENPDPLDKVPQIVLREIMLGLLEVFRGPKKAVESASDSSDILPLVTGASR
ncbi:hypothetical protein [Dehalococcoides mccartyi]|uniref:hypothetical protein n=1 Tax=Dehalococcoides mccartyi TaxID=61435 RepID=UPI0033957FB3